MYHYAGPRVAVCSASARGGSRSSIHGQATATDVADAAGAAAAAVNVATAAAATARHVAALERTNRNGYRTFTMYLHDDVRTAWWK